MVARNWRHHTRLKGLQVLGAHLNTSGTRKAAALDNRFGKAGGQLRRATFLKATPHSRANIVRVKVYPGVFYGIEASDCTDKQMASLSSAVINVFKKKNNN